MGIRFDRFYQDEVLNPFTNTIRVLWENILRLVDSDKKFYDIQKIEWVKEIETNFEIIKKETIALIKTQNIPSWQDISNDPNVRVGNKWKTFILKGYGKPVIKNIATCPKTFNMIERIPEIKTAWFSILEPNTILTPHRGPYNGVLRYHLGIIVPSMDTSVCGIDVGGEIRNWEEGKSIVFDDTHLHSAWNLSDSVRIVLFIDFLRPLPFPINKINELIVELGGKTTFVDSVIKKSSNAI